MENWYPLGNGDSAKFVKVGRGIEKFKIYSDESFCRLIRAIETIIPETTLTCMVMKKPFVHPKVASSKIFLYLLDVEKAKENIKDLNKSKRSYAYETKINLHSIELNEQLNGLEIQGLMRSYALSRRGEYILVALYNPNYPEDWYIGEYSGKEGDDIRVTPVSAFRS